MSVNIKIALASDMISFPKCHVPVEVKILHDDVGKLIDADYLLFSHFLKSSFLGPVSCAWHRGEHGITYTVLES